MNERADLDDELELRRRRLRYRAWHRGTREMDFVLGRFVDAAVAAMKEPEVAELEALLEAPDPDLFAWVTGTEPVPANYDTEIIRRMVAFHREGGGLPVR